jgi:hypothetical protein
MTNTRPLPDVAEKRRLILAFIKARCSECRGLYQGTNRDG